MSTLLATTFKEDPRIGQAIEQILTTAAEHQKKITGIREGNPDKKVSYEKFLEDLSRLRGGKLWFPYLGSGFGSGPFVELLDGSVKYDMICGIGPNFFGHNHKELMRASLLAALSDTIMEGHLQQNGDTLELCKSLTDASKLPHCFLSSSGVMANENALKLAFQKRAPAKRLLAFERCFAGRTLALSQVTDKPSFRDGLPLTLTVDYIPFFDAKEPEKSTQRAVAALKTHLARYPKEHAAMIFELVQGEAGFYFAPRTFYTSLMDLLKEHSITIIVDEVQTFGRTPELFAFQHFDLHDYIDICVIGKIAFACATLFKDDYLPRPGLLSQTFTASISAIQATLASLRLLQTGNFFGSSGKNIQTEQLFASRLEAIASKHPGLLEGPFGIGSMIAFTPFQGDTERVTKLVHTLFEKGVISFVAGSNPTRVRFLPPTGVLEEKHVDEIASILEHALLA